MPILQGSPSFHRTNLALFCGGFSTFALLYCVQPLLPVFTAQYQVPPAIASLSLSLTTIAMAISMLLVGAISDARGRKFVMTASLFGASIITLLVACSPNFQTLIILRILQGVVLAGLPAIAMAYLSEEVDSTSLGYAMGLYISGNSIGGMGGRVITGIVTEISNWQTALLVIGGLSIISAILFWLLLPASKHFKKQPFALRQLIRTLLLQGKQPKLLLLYGIGFLMMGSFVTLFNYIGYHLMAAPYGLSQTLVSWIFLVYMVGTVSSTWMGKMTDLHGRRTVLSSALVLIMAGALLTLASQLGLIVLGVALLTFGFFGGHSIASSSIGLIAKQHKAQASSLYLFFYYLGSSVSGSVGGLFYDHYDWFGVVSLIVLFMVIGLLLNYSLGHVRSTSTTS